MSTRKTIVTTTTEGGAPYPAATILPNNNHSLRCIYVWLDSDGHTITVDAAVIGWAMDATARPVPLTPHGAPPETQLMVLFDREMKHWIDADGRVFKEWRGVDEALYRRWASEHPEHINARGAQPQQAPPITEPTIGGVGLAGADHWGIGQEPPQPWKPGR